MSEPKNNNLILIGFLAVVGVIAIAVLRPSHGPTQDEFDALQAEVTALNAQVAELESRRGRRGKRVAGERPQGSISPAASEAWSDPERRIRNRIRDRIEATAPGGATSVETVGAAIEADPAVRDKITNLVRDELAAERDERWDRRRERWGERAEQRLDELSQAISLSPGQREQLGTVLSDERDTVGDLFRAAREDGSWMEAREQAVTIRAASDAQVKALLDETQYAGWEAMRVEEEERRRH